METKIIVYGSANKFKFKEAQETQKSKEYSTLTKSENALTEILFVTTFPPRECGIATYSQDLINALDEQFGTSFTPTICALESYTEQHVYAQKPKYILDTDCRNSFIKTAFQINKDKNTKLVIIQHEFGFFVKKETEFKLFYTSISKPIIFAFHTVIPHPSDELKAKVTEMSLVATSILVMTENAATILIQQYNVSSNKIKVIPHGTHLVPPLGLKKIKEQYLLSNRRILSTFGLLGKSKSIETTLEALPTIIKVHPEVLFIVLGKTHPSIVKEEGEKYRNMLEEKVISLNLEKHVLFINEYLKLPKLLEYLQLSDIYLFTSKDPNQAVSGTFSYALSCGCPVISTPIPHAKEVLNDNNGIIIDFENSTQLAKAVISLLDNEKLRTKISSNSLQKMASTAWENSAIAHALLFEALTGNVFQLTYKIPSINLDHIKRMTTNIGMIQFAKISTPDLKSGYTLDDNSRALIAICQYYELEQQPTEIGLLKIYLNFIKFCLQPNGSFLNYSNGKKEFTSQNFSENLEDSTGRAIWALGYVCALKDKLPLEFSNEAENLLQIAITNLDKIHSTRAMGFIIKGLYYQNKKENLSLLKLFANRLVQMYKHETTDDWKWYENYLTYANSLLPEAMLFAYLSTNDMTYKKIAKESFDFLLSKLFIADTIKVISNKGWYIKDKINNPIVGGEQPIDVAYTIMTLELFYVVFNNNEYLSKLNLAFEWFLGRNHLHQIVYNPCTGGCYDGIEEHNVNLNQGAESTLSYLMARLTVERINRNIL